MYGEDSTVNRLEEMATEGMGKEAALFLAGGTITNLAALLTWCGVVGERRVRVVTHYGVDDEDVRAAVAVVRGTILE